MKEKIAVDSHDGIHQEFQDDYVQVDTTAIIKEDTVSTVKDELPMVTLMNTNGDTYKRDDD